MKQIKYTVMIKNIHFRIIVLVIGGILIMTACNDNIKKNNKEMTQQDNTSLFPKGERTPKEWFSGNAYLQPLVARDKNNDFVVGSVTFEPGARTNWHTHPKGQVLIVTGGIGWYQEKGKPARRIKKGDVVNIPENTEHWHGASADNEMVHIAITNYQGEQNATWLQPVSDEEYQQVNTP